MAKLPNDIRLEIERTSASGVWKIDELLNTIKFEVEAREASEAPKTNTSGPYNQRNQDVNRSRVKDPTATALFAAQSGMKGKIECVVVANIIIRLHMRK
jgi:hypothetical protein